MRTQDLLAVDYTGLVADTDKRIEGLADHYDKRIAKLVEENNRLTRMLTLTSMVALSLALKLLQVNFY